MPGLFRRPPQPQQRRRSADVAAGGAYFQAVKTDGAIGYWRLGEATGTNANDEVGSNDGTYTNTPTLAQVGALAGVSDTAVLFTSAQSEYVTVVDDATLDQGDGPLSWECWYKRAGTGVESGTLISKGSSAPILQLLAPDIVHWYARGTSLAVSANAPVDTNWHHLVGTKSAADEWLIYIDGADVTIANLSPSTTSTATALEFGRDASSVDTFFNGSIDEVALYNVVLTPTQVLNHKQLGAPTANQLVTPGLATLTLTAFVPTVTSPRLVTPGTVALTTARFAPTVTAPRLVTPGTASLTTARFAPTVTTPRLVTPAIATLTLAAQTPSVTVGVRVTPGLATLTTTRFAPTVSTPRLVTPGLATLTTARFTPSVLQGTVVVPGTASLTTARFTPSVATPRLVMPGFATLALNPFAPTVTAGAGLTVTPGTAALVTARFTPTVLAPRLVTPGLATLVTTMFVPTVTLGGGLTLVPGSVTLVLTPFAPTVTALGAVAGGGPGRSRRVAVGVAEEPVNQDDEWITWWD